MYCCDYRVSDHQPPWRKVGLPARSRVKSSIRDGSSEAPVLTMLVPRDSRYHIGQLPLSGLFNERALKAPILIPFLLLFDMGGYLAGMVPFHWVFPAFFDNRSNNAWYAADLLGVSFSTIAHIAVLSCTSFCLSDSPSLRFFAGLGADGSRRGPFPPMSPNFANLKGTVVSLTADSSFSRRFIAASRCAGLSYIRA